MPEPITRTCRACGRDFTFSEGELAWFASLAARYPHRAVALPFSCEPCRRHRRQRGEHRSPKNWNAGAAEQAGQVTR